MNPIGRHSFVHQAIGIYTRILRWLVLILVIISGLGVFIMIFTTCSDVVLRRFGYPIKGAYDIVKTAGALTLATALPYTTAVKGHVAIEYFFHKLNRLSRVLVDSVMRLMGIMLFGFLGWRSFLYGRELYLKGDVTQTLQMPIFWLPYVIGTCCFIVMLVILHNLTHPGREIIKP